MTINNKDPIPVTLLSGFLGAGKSTLLKHILESKDHNMKIAVIVNDMAEVNIDAAMVEQNPGFVQAKKEVIAMQNGCICCTLRGDLIREINRIRQLDSFDYVIIESTGIAEPQQVAEGFCADPDTEELADDPSKMLWNVARLDTCVTVIDAHNFKRHISSLARFKDEFHDGMDNEDDQEGEKSIADLIIEQVEFSNVILLNKIDLVSTADKVKTLKLIESLNPKAQIVCTEFGVVDLNLILNTSRFNMKEAEESPGWLTSLQSKMITSESDEYGVSSFVYRSRKPFHPYRLCQWIEAILHFADKWNKNQVANEKERTDSMILKYGHILRSKGYCWVAGRDALMAGWSHSGRIIAIHPMTRWYATIPEEEWGVEEEEDVKNIQDKFEGQHGDRRQEIVFIGTDLMVDAITKSLDECLLTDEEMESHSYEDIGRYYDCLPSWVVSLNEPGLHTAILRHGQEHKFEVVEGLSLTLSNLALCTDITSTTNVVAKVWLKYEDENRRRCLLATLKSGVCEQYSLNLVIPGGEEGTFTLSVEAQNVKRRLVELDSMDSLEQLEIHVAGWITVAESEGDGEEEEEEKKDDHANCNHK